jgi:hypothetical protein
MGKTPVAAADEHERVEKKIRKAEKKVDVLFFFLGVNQAPLQAKKMEAESQVHEAAQQSRAEKVIMSGFIKKVHHFLFCCDRQ